MGGNVTPSQNGISITDTITEAIASPWAYIGMFAGASTEAIKSTYQPIADAIKLAEDASNDCLSKATQQQKVAETFKYFAENLANQASGLRDRL